jgi:hypothetical protein
MAIFEALYTAFNPVMFSSGNAGERRPSPPFLPGERRPPSQNEAWRNGVPPGRD